MFIQHIGATGLQNITDGDESYISCVEFTVYGFTGSMIPQCVQMTDGPTVGLLAVPPVYFNCGYVNANTGIGYAAGTAITTDGRYIIDTTGAKFALNVTDAGDGDFYVYGKPLAGPAPSFASGGGGGGAVTLASGAVASGAYSAGSIASGAAVSGAFADGSIVALGTTTDAAVTNPASAGTLIALTKGVLTTPTTPLPTSINDATGTNTAAVKAASTAPLTTDPALVTAISPTNWIANNATPANAATALPVYATVSVQNSGVQQPVKTAGRVLAGDTGNNSMSVGAIVYNGTTWDPMPGSVAAGQVVRPYSLPASDWSYVAASGGIQNTTAVTIKAAAAAGIKNYITNLQVTNSGAAGTEVFIRKGAAGTTIWRGYIGASVVTENINFSNPISSDAAQLLEVVLSSGTTVAVYVNAQGYTAA